jgi:ActR/RegA family two-component response regulator
MKVLLVDDDDQIRGVLEKSLSLQGFDIVTACGVKEALKQIVSQDFNVLITDLHMPDPGDGFAVVTAMRHFQPSVLTFILSGFPDVREAMDAICTDVDQVLSKPIPITELVNLINSKASERKRAAVSPKEPVAVILTRDADRTVESWLSRVEQVTSLAAIPLCIEERTGCVREVLKSVIARLHKTRDRDAPPILSPAAVAYGQIRQSQGYTAPLIVQESRILQACIFDTIQRNRSVVDLSFVLGDVMLIADEMESQLAQTMESFFDAGELDADEEVSAG